MPIQATVLYSYNTVDKVSYPFQTRMNFDIFDQPNIVQKKLMEIVLKVRMVKV